MRKHLFDQLPILTTVEPLIEAHQTSAPLQAVSRQLELVHRVHVLHMHLDARPVRSLSSPEIQVLMSPRLEVERVVAVVQVGELGEQMDINAIVPLAV